MRVTPHADDPATYDARLSDRWSVGGAINGGAQLALVGSALSHAFGDRGQPHPVAMSAVFLAPGQDGPAEVATSVVRQGGRTSVGQASLLQDGRERLRATAVMSDLTGFTGDVRTTAERPAIPPPDACVSTADAPSGFTDTVQLVQRFDLRLDPATAGWAVGSPSGQGAIQAWARFEDGHPWDVLSLLLAVDVLPPVTFDLGLGGWAPTVELTAHVRAVPAPGWVQVRHATRNLAGGLFEEDAEVWDSAGRLVAQSRQLAMVPKEHA